MNLLGKNLKTSNFFHYSNNLATKELFKQFVQKRQNVTIGELIDDGGISKNSTDRFDGTRSEILYKVVYLRDGFRTGQVPINKGVRQGDPLSLYLFLLAVEPLVATINNDTRIEGLWKGRKRNVKCPSYADDLTLKTSWPSFSLPRFRNHTKIFRGNWIKIKHGKNARHDGWLHMHRQLLY